MSAILVITYWSYRDALIQTYTLPYVRMIARTSGKKVYMLCLEQVQQTTSRAEQGMINEELKSANVEIIFFEYHRFGLKMGLKMGLYLVRLIYLIFSRNIRYLHAWCTPGGAIGYVLSLFTGQKLILDSYEPHAELMAETGTWNRSGPAFKILFQLEKAQTKRAAAVIGVVSEMANYSKLKYQYQIPAEQFFVKPACIDFDKFRLSEKSESLQQALKLKGCVVGLYAGKIGGIYLESELFDFIKQAWLFWGDNFRMLMLNNMPSNIINQFLDERKIPRFVISQHFVTHDQIPEYMAQADFAVNFMKPVPSRRYSTPIKDGEYWAMGLPVIITAGISDDSAIIEEHNIGYVMKALSVSEYDQAILKIQELLQKQGNIMTKIRSVALQYRNFSIAQKVYESIYKD